MLETNPRTEVVGPQAWSANGQTVRLLVALSLLLIALTVVIVKDRDFWFGSDEASESSAGSESTPKSNSAVAPAQAPVARAASAKSYVVPKTSTAAATDSSHKADANPVSANPASANPASANPASPVVATNRVVLPPLDVEVVAGDTHRIVHPGSNVTKVEIPSDSSRRLAVTVAANAAENERLSSGTVPELRQTVETTYPLLGQHMRVQGSVVLQALVGSRRRHRKPARSQRPCHPVFGGAASCARMALQTLSPKRTAGRNQGQNHRQLLDSSVRQRQRELVPAAITETSDGMKAKKRAVTARESVPQQSSASPAAFSVQPRSRGSASVARRQC